MDFFKKFITKKDKNQKQESPKKDDLKIGEKTKQSLKSLKNTQEKYIEEACFYMIQESGVEKGIGLLKKRLLEVEGNHNHSSVSTIDTSSKENFERINYTLQKKIEKFLFNEKRGEKVPLIRQFLLEIKAVGKSPSSLDEKESIREIINLFEKTKEKFNDERAKCLTLANQMEKLQEIRGESEMAAQPKIDHQLLEGQVEKIVDCQTMPTGQELERLLS